MSISKKKRTTFAAAVSLVCLCVFLPACSHGTKTNAADEVNSQEENSNSEKTGSVEEKPEGILSWAQDLPWEKSEERLSGKVFQEDKVLQLGETEQLGFPTNENPEKIGIECAVKTAKLYQTPEEAGLDGIQVRTEGDLLYDIETELPVVSLDTSKLSFLLCDVNIKNINLDLGEQNITMLGVACLTPDGKELRELGLPAYFSESVDTKDGSHYYNFELPAGQSMDAKVGWWIDLEQYKKENLYVIYNFGGDLDIQRLWKLDL